MFQIYLEVIQPSFIGTSAATRVKAGDFWPEYSRGLFEPDSLLSARVPQRRPKLTAFTRRSEAVSRFSPLLPSKGEEARFLARKVKDTKLTHYNWTLDQVQSDGYKSLDSGSSPK